ncbi:hypothetical protein Tco_1059662 [Tanacetum coccineum]
MKAVRSSSHVLIVPSLSSSSHVFASPASDKGNIIRQTASFSIVMWLPITANSFAVSGMVIAEPGIGATTQSTAHMGSSSMGLRF